MKSSKTKKTQKSTAASERAAREARVTTKAPRKSKAAQEAEQTVVALTKQADPTHIDHDPKELETETVAVSEPRAAEIERARALGIELASDEFLERPENLPKDAKVMRVVTRFGKKLPQPIFRVTIPESARAEEQSAGKSSGKKRAGKAASAPNVGAWKKSSVEGEKAQALLAKLRKGTHEKPVMAAKSLSDNERALARRLFAHQLIQRDKFEEGIGYFA